MGFPIARLARKAAFIGAMIGGGLLAAGIAQAQAQDMPLAAAGIAPPTTATSDDGQPTVADRQAELIAAAGGPAPVQYLMTVAPERPAVETRDDDVEDAAPDAADALNAAEVTRNGGSVPSDPGGAEPASATPRAR